ncbi:glycosyltransferase [Sphingobium nicotianae]|uniref:Glycosyltransferase n=1 Tax=Sphingobium nicotianae TaxID=2782607 RepID=A0A9X1DB51_9SPHN|nr:glycosyltransferase [Sphingobium nicotianae]MBT2186694.1 glycosyltransferase [Sphingobium nicotianae]
MKTALKPVAKRLARQYAYRQSALSATVGWQFRQNPRPIHLLLVSDDRVMTSEQQFAPFERHAAALRKALGLVTRPASIEAALAMSPGDLAGFAAIGLKLGFRTPADEAVAITRQLHDRLAGAGVPLIYFDGDDDSSIQWPGVLAASDLYVKKHAYADRADYGVTRIGKSNLTDYIARSQGFDFSGNEIPTSPAIDPALAERVMVGWNIGLDDKIADLAKRMTDVDLDNRPVDVCGRATAAPDSWIYAFREPVARQLSALEGELNVTVPTARVDQDEYYREMLSSKICVSPFGYGELCWRDFEAVLCGCLVVKPDMSHIETAPNLFVPGETYVPCAWDFSDLADACRRYATDDEARLRIVQNARDALLESLTPGWFVGRVARVLQAAGVIAD